jgi:hypothetical protein
MTEKRPHYKLKFRIAATNALKRMMPVSQRSLIPPYDCRVKATCVVFDSRTRCHVKTAISSNFNDRFLTIGPALPFSHRCRARRALIVPCSLESAVAFPRVRFAVASLLLLFESLAPLHRIALESFLIAG